MSERAVKLVATRPEVMHAIRTEVVNAFKALDVPMPAPLGNDFNVGNFEFFTVSFSGTGARVRADCILVMVYDRNGFADEYTTRFADYRKLMDDVAADLGTNLCAWWNGESGDSGVSFVLGKRPASMIGADGNSERWHDWSRGRFPQVNIFSDVVDAVRQQRRAAYRAESLATQLRNAAIADAVLLEKLLVVYREHEQATANSAPTNV